MGRLWAALGAGYLAVLTACHVTLYLFTGAVLFGHCGNGWPPPVFETLLLLAIPCTVTGFPAAAAQGLALAICVRRQISAPVTYAVGLALPAVMGFVPKSRRLLEFVEDFGAPPWDVWFFDVLLPTAFMMVAGCITAAWAVRIGRRRADTELMASVDPLSSGPRATVLMTKRGRVRIIAGLAAVLGALAAFGLARHDRMYVGYMSPRPPLSLHDDPLPPPEPPSTSGMSFSLRIGGGGPAYPVRHSIAVGGIVLLLAGAALRVSRSRP